MPNQQELLKETQELLETAQKEVLKEINTKENFLAKIFAGKNNKSLRTAQSKLARALNQMKSFDESKESNALKLQQNINDKTQALKDIEAKFTASLTEMENLKAQLDKAKAEVQIAKQKASQEALSERDTAIEEKLQMESTLQAKIDEIQASKERHDDLTERFEASQTDLNQTRKLTLELSNRLKRLKAEVTSS